MVKYDLKPIGDRIQKIMKENKTSDLNLSIEFDVDYRTISDYRRGIRPINAYILMSFCKYFNVSADYILFGKE